MLAVGCSRSPGGEHRLVSAMGGPWHRAGSAAGWRAPARRAPPSMHFRPIRAWSAAEMWLVQVRCAARGRLDKYRP